MTIPTITSFEQVDTTGISHILLDIEGTICPVEFVSDVLFPYASEHLEKFLQKHGTNESVRPLLEQTRDAWETETDSAAPPFICESSEVLPYLKWLISVDRKFPPLKEMQGIIWEKGYEKQLLRPDFFPDVPKMLRQWHDQEIIVAVYSSGSVKAQKLLFSHCSSGDLSQLISKWFDLGIGSKRAVESYQEIRKILRAGKGSKVIFISDSDEELEAAMRCKISPIRRTS